MKKQECVRYGLITLLIGCVIFTYALTFSQDLDSEIKWEMRVSLSTMLSVLVFLGLYALHRIVKASILYGVLAFVVMVAALFLVIEMANKISASAIHDLATAHLFLRMPIAIAAGLFGGGGSLLLAHAFWAKGRSTVNIILSGYFSITGLALILGYFLIDALTGFMRIISTYY